jgi:hypothetical protein
MIADAARRGAYLNPTLHYEWGGMSRRAPRVAYDAATLLAHLTCMVAIETVEVESIGVRLLAVPPSSRRDSPWAFCLTGVPDADPAPRAEGGVQIAQAS